MIGRNPEALARAAGFRRLAGVDEAGRGSWAGPVVASAVMLRKPRLAVRIDDSKRLTPLQRARAFDAIVASADIGIGIICSEDIDRWNILRATLLAMEQAIQQLPFLPDLVLIDGTCAPQNATPCWPIIRGDQRSYAISCASIIAKVTRDRLMSFYHAIAPEYDFDQHKGYGTAHHAARLAQHGPSALHRLSFAPVAAWGKPPGLVSMTADHDALVSAAAD